MLDVQRNRGAIHQREVIFTRKIMWSHMIVGAALIAMLLLHELFWWFGGAVIWYSVSLYSMLGLMNEQRWCQWALAALFILITASGLYFTTYIFPTLVPIKAPLLPHSLIPIWVGLVNLLYAIGATIMLFSGKVRKASMVGFTLW
jgi:hypothetical protein